MEHKKLTLPQLAFCLAATVLSLTAGKNIWLILPDAGTADSADQLYYLLDTLQRSFAVDFLSWAAMTALLWYLLRRLYFGKKQLRFCFGAGFLAFLFTLFFLAGGAMAKYDALAPVLEGPLQLVLLLAATVGYAILFYGIFFRLEEALPLISTFHFAPAARLAARVQRSRPLAGPMLLFCICWAPVWLLAFPGALAIDVGIQLSSFYLPDHFFNNHYPYLTTLFYAGMAYLGNLIHCPGVALFLQTAIQYFFQAYALGHMLRTLKRLGASDTLRGITMAVMAVVSLWPIYAVCVQKDTPFTAAVIILMDITAEVLFLDRPLTPRLAAGIFGLSLLICTTRNNGIYFTVPLLLCLLFVCTRKQRRLLAASLAVLIISYGLIQNVLMPLTGCMKGEKQEMLSIPFQQTARYVVQYGDEVTDEEREAIDCVLPYESLQDYYPYLSDNIKNGYHFRFYDHKVYSYHPTDLEKEALGKYFPVWFSMFLKHPLVYIEATVNNTFGYVYPMPYRQYGPVEINLSIDAALDHTVIDYTQISAMEPLRTLYVKASTFIGQLPLISLLYSPFVSVWIVGVGAVYLLCRKRWKAFVCFVPLLLNIAVCIASPVNGCTRYMYSIMTLIPYCLILLAREHRENP